MAPPYQRSSPASPDFSDARKDPALPVILEFRSPSTAIVSAPVPRFARLTVWIVTSLFVAIVLATGTIPIDREVTTRGETISKAPMLVVQPLDTSIVQSIDVHVGETVRAGTILASLNPTFASADLAALTSEVASLRALTMRLRAESTGASFTYSGIDPDLALQAAIYAERQSEYDYKLQGYQQTIDELTAEISRASSDAAGFRERLGVAQDIESMRQQLEELRVGSKLGMLSAVDNRAEMQRDYLNALQTAAAAEHNLAAEVAQRDGYVQSWHANASQQLSDALIRLADASEQLRKAQLRHQLVALRADRDATVLSMAKISVGSVVQSGEQLFTLMPADAPLEVEANIPGSQAGYVHVGDPVAIKFATFPFTRYGLAHGTLRIVSANSFTSQDMLQQNRADAVPLPPGEITPYYSARITIDRIALHGIPAEYSLVPGMPIEADIKVGRHTILQYLLQRILPIANEAMREPG
jgi:hemolysin D